MFSHALILAKLNQLAVPSVSFVTLHQTELIETLISNPSGPPQSADASSKQKSEVITRLEDKINQMTGTVKQMETR